MTLINELGFLFRNKYNILNDKDLDIKTKLDTDKNGILSAKELYNFETQVFASIDDDSVLTEDDANNILFLEDKDFDGDGTVSSEERAFVLLMHSEALERVKTAEGVDFSRVQTTTDSDGNTITTHLDKDGNITTKTKTNPAGTILEETTYKTPGNTKSDYTTTTRDEDGKLKRTIKIGKSNNEDIIINYDSGTIMINQNGKNLEFLGYDLSSLEKAIDVDKLYEFANTKKTTGTYPTIAEIETQIKELASLKEGAITSKDSNGNIEKIVLRNEVGKEILSFDYKNGSIKIKQFENFIEFTNSNLKNSNIEFTENELQELYNYATTKVEEESGSTRTRTAEEISTKLSKMIQVKQEQPEENDTNSNVTKKTKQIGIHTIEETYTDGKLTASTKTNKNGVIVENIKYHSADEKYKNYTADYTLENGDLNFSKKINEKYEQVAFVSYISQTITIKQGKQFIYIENKDLSKNGNLLDVDALYEFANTKKGDGTYPTKEEINDKATTLLGITIPDDTTISTKTKIICNHTIEETLIGRKMQSSKKTNKNGIIVEEIKYNTPGEQYKNISANYRFENGELNYSKKLNEKGEQVVYVSYTGHSISIKQGNTYLFIQNENLNKNGEFIDVDLILEFANTKKEDGTYPTKDEINKKISQIFDKTKNNN